MYHVCRLAILLHTTMSTYFARLPFWVKFLTSFNHLMAVANSSTNLALFSVIGTQFRATLLAILHLRKPPHRHTRYLPLIDNVLWFIF